MKCSDIADVIFDWSRCPVIRALQPLSARRSMAAVPGKLVPLTLNCAKTCAL